MRLDFGFVFEQKIDLCVFEQVKNRFLFFFFQPESFDFIDRVQLDFSSVSLQIFFFLFATNFLNKKFRNPRIKKKISKANVATVQARAH